MKKILILFPYQWGYNTDYMFYSTLLREKYDVTYIGYDMGLPVVPNNGVKVINVPFIGKASLLAFVRTAYRESRKQEITHIFINYFITCSLLLILIPGTIKKVVDVRTSFIYKNKFKTLILNRIMKLECSFFKHISVVSEGVAKFLKLPGRTHVLPLGGPEFPISQKKFDVINFLYVGTFYDRDIVQTLKAFSRFIASHSNIVSLKYTIIGYGTSEEIADIENHIVSLSLQDYVTYLGPIRYPELNQYFLNHNVGICYIPLTDYYDCQPPTKTFEYLLSGSVVLGTSTSENRKVITQKNGVLVQDSVDEFYNGMVHIYQNRALYTSRGIQVDAAKYSWSSIVANNLIPYLTHL